jgi:hypothetical protein
MKKLVTLTLGLLIVFSFSTLASEKGDKRNASKTIEGTVIDKTTGETLAGVEIKVEGTDICAISDLDGKFKFESMQPGQYKVAVSYISYKEYMEEIDLQGESATALKITLESR